METILDRGSKKTPMSEMEDDVIEGMELARAYVLWQVYDSAFSPQEALMKGTLFPELYGVYRIPN